jgi:hypothetical protein
MKDKEQLYICDYTENCKKGCTHVIGHRMTGNCVKEFLCKYHNEKVKCIPIKQDK